jgi:outer membrane immunogenic protein
MPYGSRAPETLNMKNISSWLGAVGSVFVVGSAVAADLSSHRGPPPVYAPPPVFSWEGWRFGVNGGYGGGSVVTYSSLLAPPAFAPAVAQTSNSISGGLVGFQTGYLWHLSNNVVLGTESDLQLSGVRSSSQTGAFNFLNVQNRLKWFGTERFRLGYAFGRFLPYVTAGLAYGRINSTVTQVGGGGAFVGRSSLVQAGFAVGAGGEYAFTDNLSAKAEYLYIELQGVRGSGLGTTVFAAAPLSYAQFNTGRHGVHIGRVGLTYRFDIEALGALVGVKGL